MSGSRPATPAAVAAHRRGASGIHRRAPRRSPSRRPAPSSLLVVVVFVVVNSPGLGTRPDHVLRLRGLRRALRRTILRRLPHQHPDLPDRAGPDPDRRPAAGGPAQPARAPSSSPSAPQPRSTSTSSAASPASSSSSCSASACPALRIPGTDHRAVLLGRRGADAHLERVRGRGLPRRHRVGAPEPERRGSLAGPVSATQSMRFVVLPQAVRRVIPPLLNDSIGLLKDTALVSFIGAVEIFRRAQIIQCRRVQLHAVPHRRGHLPGPDHPDVTLRRLAGGAGPTPPDGGRAMTRSHVRGQRALARQGGAAHRGAAQVLR